MRLTFVHNLAGQTAIPLKLMLLLSRLTAQPGWLRIAHDSKWASLSISGANGALGNDRPPDTQILARSDELCLLITPLCRLYSE